MTQMRVATSPDESSFAESNEETWTIADMSAEFGVTARALRFYEERDLVQPYRIGTQRLYTRRDKARLAWIMRAKNVGFSLDEIRELIDLYDLDDGRRTQRIVTLRRCRERIADLQRQQDDVAAAIAELTDFVAKLEDMGVRDPQGEDDHAAI